MFNWDLHHVVDIYEDFHAELAAIRNAVSIGDMSPLSKTLVTGADAPRFVDCLITRDATKLAVGQVFYTPWCNEQGKLITDGLVFRLDKTTYRFTSDPTYNWFVHNAAGYDVAITDVTDDFGILALQGPRARQVLEAMTGEDWSDLDFSRLRVTRIGAARVEVARTGFTGELGYELQVAAEEAASVWDHAMEAGEPFGLRPAGEYALDVARVEAGLLIIGPDYAGAGPDPAGSHTPASRAPEYLASPFELGLGRLVDFRQGDFLGKQALAEEKTGGGPRRRLVGLEIDWHGIVDFYLKQGILPNVSPRVRWQPLPMYHEDRMVGRASSVVWSPTLKRLIGFGHIENQLSEIGTELGLDWPVEGGESGHVRAAVVKIPFLDLKRSA
jgi:aminomethyltransferase